MRHYCPQANKKGTSHPVHDMGREVPDVLSYKITFKAVEVRHEHTEHMSREAACYPQSCSLT